MFERSNHWKNLALAAQAEVDQLRTIVDKAALALEEVAKTHADRAALISITRDGRKVRFLFSRNEKMIPIEMFGTWDDDVDGWNKQLLGKE